MGIEFYLVYAITFYYVILVIGEKNNIFKEMKRSEMEQKK